MKSFNQRFQNPPLTGKIRFPDGTVRRRAYPVIKPPGKTPKKEERPPGKSGRRAQKSDRIAGVNYQRAMRWFAFYWFLGWSCTPEQISENLAGGDSRRLSDAARGLLVGGW